VTRVVVAGENLVDLIVCADGTITPVAGGGPYNAGHLTSSPRRMISASSAASIIGPLASA
jgi:hypothetical protein